jgi:hypothetical protein
LGPGRLFKRPYGTLSVFAREPGAEAPGYYQTSLREFGERRYQPKCYTPMLNAKCRMPTANADCECRLRMPTACKAKAPSKTWPLGKLFRLMQQSDRLLRTAAKPSAFRHFGN